MIFRWWKACLIHKIYHESLNIYSLCSLFWDFTLESNATMHERFPCTLPPPHNDIEMMRSVLVSKLRQQYQELCMAREGKHCHSNFIFEKLLSLYCECILLDLYIETHNRFMQWYCKYLFKFDRLIVRGLMVIMKIMIELWLPYLQA